MSSEFPSVPGAGSNQAGQPAYQQPMSASNPPNNYLVLAIISALLCLPFGVAGIIFSTQVNSKWNAGDQVGAAEASRKAKMFAIVGVCLGLLTFIMPLLMIFGVLAVDGLNV